VTRGFLLTRKLLNQRFLLVTLRLLLRKFYSDRWPRICSVCRSRYSVLLSAFIPYHHIFNKSNTTGAISRAVTNDSSGAPESPTPDFMEVALLNLLLSVQCLVTWPLFVFKFFFFFGHCIVCAWYLQTFLVSMPIDTNWIETMHEWSVDEPTWLHLLDMKKSLNIQKG